MKKAQRVSLGFAGCGGGESYKRTPTCFGAKHGSFFLEANVVAVFISVLYGRIKISSMAFYVTATNSTLVQETGERSLYCASA